MKKSKRPLTNIEIVVDAMRFSEYGAMAQVFIIDAIQKHADRVAKSVPSDYPPNQFISPEIWIGVAKEIQSKMKETK